MANTGLFGPLLLTDSSINIHVSANGIGCYALGRVESNGTFIVRRIGRSDAGLNGRIHEYVSLGKYTHFKYGFFDTVQKCYEHECRMWHDFNPPDNQIHPDKPKGTNYFCPVPGCPH